MTDLEILGRVIDSFQKFADELATLTGCIPDTIEADVPQEQWTACAYAIRNLEAKAWKQHGNGIVEFGLHTLVIYDRPGGQGPVIRANHRDRSFHIEMNRRR